MKCPALSQPTQNPESLLIFAAGNDGDIDDGRDFCTMASPAIAKNLLAIGSTSSGKTRLTTTTPEGEFSGDFNGGADIDTVSFFSSYGPTRDGRIKPELVAPGDMVRVRTPVRIFSCCMGCLKTAMWAKRVDCVVDPEESRPIRGACWREFSENVQCIA